MMHPHTIMFTLVTFLHNLFTMVWIGGLIAFGITFLPTIRKVLGKSRETRDLVAEAQRRHSTLVYISMAGLAFTGFMMGRRNPDFSGLFSFATGYSAILSVKHIVMLTMVGLTLYNSLMLHGNRQRLLPESKKRLSTALVYANLICGVIILLLSSILAVNAPPPALGG